MVVSILICPLRSFLSAYSWINPLAVCTTKASLTITGRLTSPNMAAKNRQIRSSALSRLRMAKRESHIGKFLKADPCKISSSEWTP